jgi:hypothetical protein
MNSNTLADSQSIDLVGLLTNDGGEDFFSSIVSLQLQTRQKALRKLKLVDIPVAAFRKCLLPLVDFLIFDIKVTKLKDRNAVRYTKDQTAQLMEDALNVYQSYAAKLKWSDAHVQNRQSFTKDSGDVCRQVRLRTRKSSNEMLVQSA